MPQRPLTKCRSCGRETAGDHRFCPACGLPVDPDAAETVSMSSGSASSPSSRLRSSSGSLNEGRFLPGTLLADRYRIIAKLGQGGMGEVYRADDLVLQQAVALKFLSVDAASNPEALTRFRSEVRIARQVSHPNVCRVYDVGEIEGMLFLSMEYVDGEDLGALLRRIGRLPEDKALEIARKLCAGLAAAHEKGVLHRDLKPGNVMLDARGQVLIADFGLAAFADQIEGAEVRNGTPAYMAPEQLAGKAVTVRSEIYSLGLVLYELFTGKKPFESSTLADMVRTRNETTPASPSSFVKEFDPAIERVILRCLETDPSLRPASALAVAAALPGGDPLAAALAAGETPSPQMVAASGETTGISPRIAIACLAFVLAGLAVTYFLDVRYSALEIMRPEYSSEILTQKAREILKRLGYVAKPADFAESFFYDTEFLPYVQRNDGTHPHWDEIISQRPKLLRFWYRESARPMVADGFPDDNLTPGIVRSDEPPPIESGMIRMETDYEGRLTYFEAIPPQLETPAAPADPIDWNVLFAAASLDPRQFQSTEPLWNSLAASDARMAWTGTWPGSGRPLRVEAAAWRGKPVFFSLIGPWKRPERMQPYQRSAAELSKGLLLMSLGLLMTIAPAWVAWRNHARGKTDRRGAFRLAAGIFAAHLLLWLCRGHFVMAFGTFGMFILAICTSLFHAIVVWVLYLALEPYVRRHWPQTIVSWSRLLAGRVRDPVVGRDVLFGIVLALVWLMIFQIGNIVASAGGAPPGLDSETFLMGARSTLAGVIIASLGSVRSTLVFFFLFFLLKVWLRKQWLAGAAFVTIWTLVQALGNDHIAISAPVSAAVYLIAAVALLRFGLVTLAVAVFTVDLVGSLPMTLNSSAWYFGDAVFVLLMIVAMAVWGFHAATIGRPLFKEDLFE